MRAAEARWQNLLASALMVSLAACKSSPDEDDVCAPQELVNTDDAGADCSAFFALPCGFRDATIDDCYPDLDSCRMVCGTNNFYCQLTPSSCTLAAGVLDATMSIECVQCTGGGRRPRGLLPARISARSELGAYFAELGHLEAASVRAFRDLESWLARSRAPARLVRAAKRAQRDEIAHARAARRLAQRFQGQFQPPRVCESKLAGFVSRLEEDAIEGCAGETFGALVATWQSMNARDARIRNTMKRIAVDETRHASLAWEILRWGLPRVTPRERARLGTAIDNALVRLSRFAPRLGREARKTIGVPNARETMHLANALRAVAARELARY